jgi:hypothetical protein
VAKGAAARDGYASQALKEIPSRWWRPQGLAGPPPSMTSASRPRADHDVRTVADRLGTDRHSRATLKPALTE